jgi:hypothetical protein
MVGTSKLFVFDEIGFFIITRTLNEKGGSPQLPNFSPPNDSEGEKWLGGAKGI